MATLTLTTAAGTSTQTLSTGARGPAGPTGGGGTYTAGDGISISGGVISATGGGGTYTAGTGISITDSVISATGSTVDATITDGSTNAVSSNAVFDALALKAPLASPTFTGPVTADTHQAATTAGIVVKNSDGVALVTIGKYDATSQHSTGVAEGLSTLASGYYSHAEGGSTTASGDFSHAEGDSTLASGYYSHAEGYSTTASGDCSHAEGLSTTASGDYSHAAGRRAQATHSGSRVMTDGQDADCPSTADNQCTFRYQNGYRFLGGAADFAVAPTVTGSGTVALTNPSSGTQTFSGAHAFSSTTRPTSSGTGTPASNSLITLADGDARFGREHIQIISTPVQAFSTAYVNGPDLVLPAGTYDFELFGLLEIIGETSGGDLNFRCSPATDVTTAVETRLNNIGALGAGGTASTSFRKGTVLNLADHLGTTFATAPNNYGSVQTRGTTVLGSETTVSFRVKQRVTDAVNPATLAIGSFIKFTKR